MSRKQVIAILAAIDELDFSRSFDSGRSPSLNAAAVASALGHDVRFVAEMPNSAAGEELIELLQRLDIDTTHIRRASSPESGAGLPIDELFTSGCCVVDLDDPRSFRFLVDLPVHTHPAAQLAGSLDRLAEMPVQIRDEILQRLDGVAGTLKNAAVLTGVAGIPGVLQYLQKTMRFANLRYAFLSGEGNQDYLVTRQHIWLASSDLPTGSEYSRTGRALGGLAYALADRALPKEMLELCVATSRISIEDLRADTHANTVHDRINVEEFDSSSI